MPDNIPLATLPRADPLRRVEAGGRWADERDADRMITDSAVPTGEGWPTPAPRVNRARLLSALDEPVSVTVLRAPAGFGKTFLLRHWHQSRRDVVWLTVRPEAAGETSWWPRITRALTQAGHPAAGADRVDQGSAQSPGAGPVTLILDDVDTLFDRPPDEELLGLLRSRPDLRVVLAGRGGSWFPDDLLADIGARVIRADELLFTRQETATLLLQALPYLAYQGSYWIDQLHRSTGGWPDTTAAVARRMALAMPVPIELSAIVTRTTTDLLRGRLMPELERAGSVDLALATAVAGPFCAGLAGTVTGHPDTPAALSRLVDRGLLIAETIGGGTTFRWPEAAQRVLMEELTCRDPGRVAALHTEWARGYLEHGNPRAAVQHALAGRDWRLLVTVIDTQWRALLEDDGAAIRQALIQAPPQALTGSARALALREILLFATGSLPGLLPAEEVPALPSLPTTSRGLAWLAGAEQLTDVLDAGLLVAAAHRHRGRHPAALDHARRLLEIATLAHPRRPAEVAGFRPSIQLAVGVGLLLTGDVPRALTALEAAFRLGAAGSGPSGRFVVASSASLLAMQHAVLGEVTASRRWLTQLEAAETAQVGCSRALAHIHVAAAIARLLIAVDDFDLAAADTARNRLAMLDPANPWLDLWAFAAYAQAQYALYRGDVHAALDQLSRARTTHGHDLGDDGIAAPLLAAAQANLLIAAGRAGQAQRCLGTAPSHPLLRVPGARMALLSGDPAAAARLGADQAWEYTAGTRDRVEMWLIRAIAAGRSGNPQLAAGVLDRAVRATRESGLRSAWATVSRGELNALTRNCAPAAQVLSDPALTGRGDVFPGSVVLIELTRREQDVLDLLAAGVSLQAAAAALTISYNTVKTHVHSIYRRLRVDSRQAAVAEALRLGLLPSLPH